jgi:hypothetical protein
MADALAISADTPHPTNGAGRAAASWHGLSQVLRLGMTEAVGELHAVWVSDYQ